MSLAGVFVLFLFFQFTSRTEWARLDERLYSIQEPFRAFLFRKTTELNGEMPHRDDILAPEGVTAVSYDVA